MIQLTEEQRRAVESESRDVLCIAGAGAGKTRVLTERIRYLIEQKGISPASMIVLTFTRKSANELLHRLAANMPDDPLRSGMLCGTFHSVALKLLKADGDKLGLVGPSIEVLAPDDADAILEQCCRDLGYLKADRWTQPMSGQRIREYREAQYTGRELGWLKEFDVAPFARAFGNYRHTLMSLNCLDFGLILMECTRLLTEFPAVLDGYRKKIGHVLVDELQDSDATQYRLHDFFAPPATFFGVGDTRQAIYGFRGARPDLMLERHPNAEVVNLTECFRCDSTIVKAANKLIAVNAEPMTKPLTCATGKKGRVVRFHGRSEQIANVIIANHRTGFAWRDMVVLARTHRALSRIQECCAAAGVPCHRVGASFGLFASPEFRTLHRILRLIANPHDDVAFLSLTELLGIDGPTLATLRSHAHNNAWPLWKAYTQAVAGSSTLGVLQATMMQVNAEWTTTRIVASLQRFTIPACVEYWTTNYAMMPLPEALRTHAMRYQEADSDILTADVVQLMTVHAAKGLEFPMVLVANLNEGDFPSSQSAKAHGVNEERRLAYVAFTRAKESLVLHWREPEDQSEGRTAKAPSRFLEEAGATK